MEQTNTPVTRHIVVVAKQKSVGVALLLTFFFGPLGLLYASVLGGVIMIVLSLIIGFLTLGLGLIFTWLASLIWAVIALTQQNKKTAAVASTL